VSNELNRGLSPEILVSSAIFVASGASLFVGFLDLRGADLVDFAGLLAFVADSFGARGFLGEFKPLPLPLDFAGDVPIFSFGALYSSSS
jgi:hypothetical protein